MTKLQPCPNYIGGEWNQPKGAFTPVYNPSTGDVIVECPAGGAAVKAPVEAALRAFPTWRDTPAVEHTCAGFSSAFASLWSRISTSFARRYRANMADARRARGAFTAAGEHRICLRHSVAVDGRQRSKTSRAAWIAKRNLQPLGVCAGITPFNFPVMVPLWMIPVALACGNTFILKPSEKVPLSADPVGRNCWRQAGLPKGVFNIVHGGRDCVDVLLTHPQVRAISFVGSSPIAKYIYETGTRNGKRVQANGGAKNYIVVMPDAEMNKTVENLATAAFGCAGERCMAGSTALPVGKAAEKLLPSLIQAARAIKVGPTDRPAQPDMGPVITAQHRDRVMTHSSASGEKEGAKVVCRRARREESADAPNGF